MRLSDSRKELQGFGVNYTLPFAHEFRMAKNTGISLEEAIRQDVYHMARLDVDLFRVHVWDTEISDTLGNLINNEHLKLFDFAVSEMKKRGIRFVITPIAYWGNGWPEKDEVTPGFSHRYGKAECLTNPDAIEAQANYLNQFLMHVNPYTGFAYKDDPAVIGFEICNEPHHDESSAKVTSFINKMVASMRQTGTTKLIFYNMSHSIHLAGAYLDADIQGGTFQWYPTNLVANQKIKGNFLPHVDSYPIPFANDPRFRKMAKIVYEFDPADVDGNIMYPAMARTFRSAGMQLAAQFAYDAMCWAPFNTNYGTHFLNMAYTPHKAISLKIASAIFHTVPMYQQYKDNLNFNGVRLSYAKDLAELNTAEKFFYSNNTGSAPMEYARLKEIAGCGSSAAVKYNGTGAYFLDKLSEGIWRLEVMPDVYWINDPYTPVNPNKQKAAVKHQVRQITISLPDLGNDFLARALQEGKKYVPVVSNGTMDIVPGVYLLKRKDITENINADFTYKNIKVGEFVAPSTNLHELVFGNNSPDEVVAGKPLKLKFRVASPSSLKKIQVVLSNGYLWKTLDIVPQEADSVYVDVPEEMITTGFLKYRVIVEDRTGITKFPGAMKGDPWSWENRDDITYTIRVVPEDSPLMLWEADRDWESSYKIWNRNVMLKPTPEGETAVSVVLKQLPAADPVDSTNRNYAFKFFFGDKIKGRYAEVPQKKILVIKAANLLPGTQPVEVGLIDRNGAVRSGIVRVKAGESIYRLPLNSLSRASFLIIPRPFPEFLPYQLPANEKEFNVSSAETIQLIVKPGGNENVSINIEKIWLE
jgi:hypothetical protein